MMPNPNQNWSQRPPAGAPVPQPQPVQGAGAGPSGAIRQIAQALLNDQAFISALMQRMMAIAQQGQGQRPAAPPAGGGMMPGAPGGM